jgi:hypothetical protein
VPEEKLADLKGVKAVILFDKTLQLEQDVAVVQVLQYES